MAQIKEDIETTYKTGEHYTYTCDRCGNEFATEIGVERELDDGTIEYYSPNDHWHVLSMSGLNLTYKQQLCDSCATAVNNEVKQLVLTYNDNQSHPGPPAGHTFIDSSDDD